MEQKSNGKAVASLVLGIISIVCSVFGIYTGIFGLIAGIVAIVLGNGARKEQPSGIAMGGFVCGIIGTVLCGLIVVACSCLLGGAATIANSYY